MKHRLPLALLAATARCSLLVAGAGANHGRRHAQNQRHVAAKGQLYTFAGELLAAPGANATSLSVQIETGNRPALKALIGASENEVFALNSGSEILIGQHGVPHVGSTADLRAGDYV